MQQIKKFTLKSDRVYVKSIKTFRNYGLNYNSLHYLTVVEYEMPSVAAKSKTRLAHVWKDLLNFFLFNSQSTGVAKATGTVITKITESNTKKNVKIVAHINFFNKKKKSTFLFFMYFLHSSKNYKFPFFNASAITTLGPSKIIPPVATNCPITCQLIIRKNTSKIALQETINMTK